MHKDEWQELLYQALEAETCGIRIYENAVECAVHPDLKAQWQRCLEQTRNHELILENAFEKLGLNPGAETPGRAFVRQLGDSLVQAIRLAKRYGQPADAELVAAECVLLAETKDPLNWGSWTRRPVSMPGRQRRSGTPRRVDQPARTTIAMPCPPPMQADATPIDLPLLASSSSSV